MEREEIEQIQALSASHDELRHLWHRHQRFEESLGRLSGLRYPSEAERREMGKIKRLKLRGKERISQILAAQKSS